MAVSSFRSTSRKMYDIRGVEIEVPATPSLTTSPTQSRRSVSRNTSPVRRSMSRNPSPTRRSMSRNTSPTRRSMSRNTSPVRRSISRNPSPTRRSISRNPSPPKRSVSVSRNSSPSRRSRRGTSRGPSPSTRGPPSTPSARSQSRPTSPTRRMSMGSQPSRATSPQKASGKPIGRVLRRTQSFADLSFSPYLSDAAAAIVSDAPVVVAAAPPPNNVTVRPSARTSLVSDSESDVEPRYLRRLDRGTRRDSSDTESIQPTKSSSRRASGQRAGSLRRSTSMNMEMRRSLNQMELADASTPVYYQKSKPVSVEDQVAQDDGDAHIEEKTVEKTIQEVHTQTKVQSLCYNCLYEVSSSAELPPEFVSPNGVKIKVLGSAREAPSGEVDFIALYNARCAEVRRAVSEARSELENVKEPHLQKELKTKLEESEKKVSELWSQYSKEEQKCLHLVKCVQDVKDGHSLEPDLEPEPEKLKPHKLDPVDMIDEADFIRQSLDEEAARYFEECVIIANFDAHVVDDISVYSERSSLDNDAVVCDEGSLQDSRHSTSRSKSSESKSGRSKHCLPLDDEGMLLPWLDWEPEVDLGRKERLEKAVCGFREWKSSWARKSVEWGKSSNRERGKDEGAANVDEFLFERTRLQPYIANGRMIVCGGKR